MENGFIKVAAAKTNIAVADIPFNTTEICNCIENAEKNGIKLLVLPELSLTGATCGDLFLSKALLNGCISGIKAVTEFTKQRDICVIFGAPINYLSKIYNCAVVVLGGEILGICPKTSTKESVFASADSIKAGSFINLFGKDIPIERDIVFSHKALSYYSFSVNIGRDLLFASHSNGVIIANPSADNEIAGSFSLVKESVKVISGIKKCAVIYSNADSGESTTDFVYGGGNIIAENSVVLESLEPFSEICITASEVDCELIGSIRQADKTDSALTTVFFDQKIEETVLTRKIEKNPFVPEYIDKNSYFESALKIQSYGLKKRLSHTKSTKTVLGISGGLDSTLALLVCVRATDILGLDRKNICAFTLPCFGTTSRTKSNAIKLCEALGVSIEEINITEAVNVHLKDIKQPDGVFDAAFENAQARERTQVLMDLANRLNAIVIGTGDLSELALGWATYNGDQMSMYSLNGSIPKTLVRSLVSYEAERLGGEVCEILKDIVDTPVSPELLPADKDGEIAQKTEDIVGPYELHDFFIYNTVRYGFSPKKVFRLAVMAFDGIYTEKTIKKWLVVFIRRFFSQQFKRSCMPDGPAVTEISLSPRASFKMPSDACACVWLEEAEKL